PTANATSPASTTVNGENRETHRKDEADATVTPSTSAMAKRPRSKFVSANSTWALLRTSGRVSSTERPIRPIAMAAARTLRSRARQKPEERTRLVPASVPLADAYLDAAVLADELREALDVAATIVIRIDDIRRELTDRIRGLLFRHRVRQVERDERDVDVLERAHFRDVLGVAGDIDARAAEIRDVAVTPALLVVAEPLLGEVVHRYRLDADAENLR